MFFHQAFCISAQQTFGSIDLALINPPVNGCFKINEPAYPSIPLNVLRRMGKAVRISIGAAREIIITNPNLQGIIWGTANGGMEDCIRFLNQLVEFKEGTLTPTNFVQSTPNAIAATVGMQANNHHYNCTHVHRGHAFENALLDAAMHVRENDNAFFLLGGTDEISNYNYNIERLGNWYKTDFDHNTDFYNSNTSGTIAGEGVATFCVSGSAQGAWAKLTNLKMLTTTDSLDLSNTLKALLDKHYRPNDQVLFLSGDNGDIRFAHIHQRLHAMLPDAIPVARFKHFTGEFPTVSALAFWLALQFLKNPANIPLHFFKSPAKMNAPQKIIIHNHYKGLQHSFLVVEKV
jgi:hypothetical protein